LRQEDNDQVSAAVAEITEARSTIDQAKGMLMVIYQIDADTAFDLLKWRSQEANVKVRLLAEQICTEFRAVDHDEVQTRRETYDNILLTAHLRVRSR
jgi:AmiR/NasT family two-component response regulator